jgi:hypothetical protein
MALLIFGSDDGPGQAFANHAKLMGFRVLVVPGDCKDEATVTRALSFLTERDEVSRVFCFEDEEAWKRAEENKRHIVDVFDCAMRETKIARHFAHEEQRLAAKRRDYPHLVFVAPTHGYEGMVEKEESLHRTEHDRLSALSKGAKTLLIRVHPHIILTRPNDTAHAIWDLVTWHAFAPDAKPFHRELL